MIMLLSVLLRGIKTLSLRMQKHNENSKKVAEWLRTHPKVKKVYYAGFEDHIGYEISKKQCTGFGGMVSFELDSKETAMKLLSVLMKVHMVTLIMQALSLVKVLYQPESSMPQKRI